jgi:hypothetical protein
MLINGPTGEGVRVCCLEYTYMYIWKGGGGTRCHAGKRAGSRDTCLFYCVCKHKQKASPSPALAGLAQLTKRMLESDVPRVHVFIVSASTNKRHHHHPPLQD